jgi:hypothetical protein
VNHVNPEVENKPLVILCERYSRTCGYFGSYANLSKGKKSERDDRVYYKIPDEIYRASTRNFNTRE